MYSLDGKLVRSFLNKNDAATQLQKGVYVTGNKKFIVK